MKIVNLVYHHRHGTDVRTYRVPDNCRNADLPELTNETMLSLGFSDPELELEGEYANWEGIVEVEACEHVPPALLRQDIYSTCQNCGAPIERRRADGVWVHPEGCEDEDESAKDFGYAACVGDLPGVAEPKAEEAVPC